MTTKPRDLKLGITRRRILTGGVATAAAIGLGWASSGDSHAEAQSPALSFASVHVSQEVTHAAAIEAALAEASLFARIRRGDTVLLKVNTNSGDKFPYSTSPTMVRCLGSRLRDCGAKVIVGDRSFWGDNHTERNLEENGIAPAARAVAAKVVSFDDKVAWTQIPNELVSHWRGGVRVPRVVRDCDFAINLPCVKTHFITSYTMALKNVLGLVHPEDRARPGNLRTHDPRRIYHQIADINRFVRFDWHLLDGFEALVTGGPTPQSGAKPTVVSPGVVIASKDPIATDAVGIALLHTLSPKAEKVTRSKTWENPMIKAAVAAGVGISRPEELKISGARVPGLARLRRLAT